MREIEFRGKRKDNHQWVSGYFVKDDAETPFIHAEAWAGKSLFAVIPETVGQYTGLKDKNGVKIFEGNIVKIDNDCDKETITGFIVYEYASWQIDCGSELISLYQHHSELEEYQTVEVIGNIHDTPGLLGWE